MVTFLAADEPAAQDLRAAIAAGDHGALRTLLAERPILVTAYLGDPDQARTALHVATDWPGHFPGVAATIALLAGAGADVDAPFVGRHTERPLHWAASSDDVEAIAALLAAGADIEAPGGVLTGGPPLDDAIVFGNLAAARALVAAGATVALFHAAALGLDDRVAELIPASPQEWLDAALWHACRNGHTGAAGLLLTAGADARFGGWDDTDTVAAARASGNAELVALVERAVAS